MNNFLNSLKVRWWLFLVERKRKDEQYAEALQILHKVIAKQPQRALAFVQSGYCLIKLHRPEEALHSCEKALQVAPNYGEAHAYMGTRLP